MDRLGRPTTSPAARSSRRDELYARGIINEDDRTAWRVARRGTRKEDRATQLARRAARHAAWLQLSGLLAVIPGLLGGVGLFFSGAACAQDPECAQYGGQEFGPLGLVFGAYAIAASAVVMVGVSRPDAPPPHVDERPSVDAEYERILKLAHARARPTAHPTQALDARQTEP